MKPVLVRPESEKWCHRVAKEMKGRFAWQGLSVDVPADWSLGAIGGDAQEGSFRLDGLDMPRLLVKWSRSDGPVNLGAKIEDYLKQLQKKSKKAKYEFSYERNTHLIGKRGHHRSGVECYHWEADVQSHGAGWQCEDCGRVILAEVMGPLEEDTERLARQVLGSLEDHGGDWIEWSLYELRSEIPAEFEMTDHKFMSALLELDFTNDTERLGIIRWGLAATVLKGTPLSAWAEQKVLPRLKHYETELSEMSYRGHDAIAITGEKTEIADRLRRLGRRLANKDYADTALCRLWHCTDTNRIFYVECQLDQDKADLAEEVFSRVHCHELPETNTRGNK